MFHRSLAATVGCNPTAETGDLLSCLQQVVTSINLVFLRNCLDNRKDYCVYHDCSLVLLKY